MKDFNKMTEEEQIKEVKENGYQYLVSGEFVNFGKGTLKQLRKELEKTQYEINLLMLDPFLCYGEHWNNLVRKHDVLKEVFWKLEEEKERVKKENEYEM